MKKTHIADTGIGKTGTFGEIAVTGCHEGQADKVFAAIESMRARNEAFAFGYDLKMTLICKALANHETTVSLIKFKTHLGLETVNKDLIQAKLDGSAKMYINFKKFLNENTPQDSP